MNPAAVYDIETENWTTFVLGAIHYRDGQTELFTHEREAEMVEALLAIDGEVWAHNGGRFDHLWLLDRLDVEAHVQTNTSGIISMRVDGSAAVFLDSMRVFPFSLAVLTAGAKKSLADLCTCGKSCGGYCAIRRRMSARVRSRVTSYLISDVEELMAALLHFSDRAREWGFSIRNTLGSTSWHSAEKELKLERVAWDRTMWKKTRAGYYGGRCEVFHREAPRGWQSDVNSMYSWALTNPLPFGVPRERVAREARRSWIRARPGIYHATVHVPDMWIPPLPFRVKTGLAFPVGKMTGAWARPELAYAESLGCKIARVHSAVVWQDEREIFTPWIRRLWVERAKYGKDSREGKWLKWVLNSLTGKLGTRALSRRVKVNPDLTRIALCQCMPAPSCRCGGWRPLSDNVWEQIVLERDPEPCSHPEWAAYLTAYARIRLHAQLIAGGHDDAVYCDTDCVWSLEKREGEGGDLGEWAAGTLKGRLLTGECRNFDAMGPKAYRAEQRFADNKSPRWGEIVRLKGVPDPNWEAVKEGEPQSFFSMRGVRRPSESGKFFERLSMQRRVSRNTGRRKPGKKGDPKTYPIRVERE